jgi:dihydrofolate reductase
MRTLSALVFNHSLNGLLADRGTEFWTFCFDLLDQGGGPDHDDESLDFLQGAYAHIMGRTAYEGMAAESTPASQDPNLLRQAVVYRACHPNGLSRS